MNLHILAFAILLFLFLSNGCQSGQNPFNKNEALSHIQAKRSAQQPRLDGFAYDACWKEAEWHPINHLWLGKEYDKDDFSGHFKVSWSDDYIYILAEIVDDKLMDSHRNGLQQYQDDDCIVVFVDENMSGGNHEYSYNAFAYHVGLDGKPVDIGIDSLPHFYDFHIISKKTANGTIYTWELAMNIYDDSFVDNSNRNSPIKLSAGKKLGFAIAYSDNDFSEQREHYIGSVPIAGEDKDKARKDASVLGSLELVE